MKKVTVVRRRLGRRLRRMRQEAGLTRAEAARKLEKNLEALQRVETGTSVADVHLIRSMMDLYDAHDDTLLDLARHAKKPPWWRAYHPTNPDYIDLEHEADAIVTFAALTIPELLRTDRCAQALFPCHGRTRAENRAYLAMLNIRRQRIGGTHNSLTINVILDEAALTRPIGDHRIMAEQLRYLAELGTRNHTTIRVLPFGAGAHAGMPNGFTLLTFPEPDDPTTLYISHPSGNLRIEDPDAIHTANHITELLRHQALPPPDSRALLLDLAEHHETLHRDGPHRNRARATHA